MTRTPHILTAAAAYAILLTLAASAHAQSQRAATDPDNAKGWTLLFPGTHRIYVSSSAGSDAAGNGSALRPFKTLGRAARAVQDGDDLLLKRGDTFPESLGNQRWSHVTIGAYGIGPRPVIAPDTANASGIVVMNGQNVRFTGLHFSALHRDPAKPDFKPVDGQYGIYCMNCNNVLVEDCLVEFFNFNLSIQGNANTGLRLRRSVIRNAYSVSKGFAQGLFLDGQKNALVEDCLFDNNGWNPILQAEFDRRKNAPASQPATAPVSPNPQSAISNQQSPAAFPWLAAVQPNPNEPFPGTPVIFNHGIYGNVGNGAGPLTVRNCVFVNSASTGAQLRAGGTIDNCLFIHNGKATDAFVSREEGEITNCVVLGSKSCPPWAGGGGLTLFAHAGKLQNNIVAHGAPPQQGAALLIDTSPADPPVPPGSLALVDHNVVFDWPADDFLVFHTRPNVRVTNNVLGKTPTTQVQVIDTADAAYAFDANVYEQSAQTLNLKQHPMGFADFERAAMQTASRMVPTNQLNFPDPGRTIESYAQFLGLPAPTLEAFTAAAGDQSRDHWDPRLTAPVINDYFREAFGLKN